MTSTPSSTSVDHSNNDNNLEKGEKRPLDTNEEDDETDHTKGPVKNKAIVVALLFLSMSGLMFGSDTGTISGITGSTEFLNTFGNVPNGTGGKAFDNRWDGLAVSSVYIGAFFGCFLSSPLADRVGRKKSVLVWCIVYLIGTLIQITTFKSYAQYVVGRVVDGLAIGALSVITPSYQSETSPPQVRGTIVTTYQLMVTLGILLGYCITIGTHSQSQAISWRVPVGINMFWGVAFFTGTLFLPESPRFMMRIGEKQKAKDIIAYVQGRDHSDPAVEKEYESMHEGVEKELEGGPVSWLEIFGPEIRYRTFLGMAVMALQQLTGNNYFFLFAATTFAGVGVSDPFVASIILGAVNFGCTFPGLMILEKFGRRKPLIYGGMWMFVCLCIYGGVGWLFRNAGSDSLEAKAGIVMICFTCFFIAAFASTWAPCCYVIVAESYPLRYRTKCSAVATASNWLLVFLIGFCSNFVTDKIHYFYGFVFAGCNLAGAAVIFFFAKETKGLSLEEINMLYASKVKPWQSAGWAQGLSQLDKRSRKEIEQDKVKKFDEQREHVDAKDI